MLVGNSSLRTQTNLEGTIAICYYGQWGTICGRRHSAQQSDYFGVEEAMVVCRQLGHSDKGKEILSIIQFLYAVDILLRNMFCIHTTCRM